MTSAPARASTISPDDGLHDPRLRLRLKPKGPTTGWVDGAWWPRSRDLAAELPGLLTVLAVRMGRIERVGCSAGDWEPAARKILCDGKFVHVAAYHMPVHTMDVVARAQRLTLLVVPPETPETNAHAALMAAGHRGNDEDVETLLRSGG